MTRYIFPPAASRQQKTIFFHMFELQKMTGGNRAKGKE